MSESGILSRIEQVMIGADMNQAQFAEALGISRAGLSHILHGRNNVSDKFIKKVCYTFGVRLDWLVSGDGEPYADQDEDSYTATKPSPADVVRVTITQALKEMPDADVLQLAHLIDMVSGLRAGGMRKYYPDWKDPHDGWAGIIKDKEK